MKPIITLLFITIQVRTGQHSWCARFSKISGLLVQKLNIVLNSVIPRSSQEQKQVELKHFTTLPLYRSFLLLNHVFAYKQTIIICCLLQKRRCVGYYQDDSHSTSHSSNSGICHFQMSFFKLIEMMNNFQVILLICF